MDKISTRRWSPVPHARISSASNQLGKAFFVRGTSMSVSTTGGSVAAALVSTRCTPYKIPYADKEKRCFQEAHSY